MALSPNFASSILPSRNPNCPSLATPFSYKPISRHNSLMTMASINMAPSLGISETFVRLKEQGKVAFIPFITAGDPDLSTTSKALKILDSCGSDIIELGMPYSDPLADGPVIQAAATRALAKGTNFNEVISMLREVVPQVSCPIALFTYYNPILKRGVENFMSTIKNVGVHAMEREDPGTSRVDGPPARTRDREPSPIYSDVPSPSRRRRYTPQVGTPRSSTDWSASPLPQQLLTPEEMPSEHRSSVDVEHTYFGDFGVDASLVHTPELVPNLEIPSMDISLRWDSLFSHPEETSEVPDPAPVEALTSFSYTPIVTDLASVFAPFSCAHPQGHEGTSDSGLVVPDVPLEETEILRKETAKHNIELVLLTTPTTPTDRMKAIVEASEGFVYLVSSVGVTGTRSSVSIRVQSLLQDIKKATDKPVAVGFGISEPEHVKQVAGWGADGVIVGSAIVKILAEAKSPEQGLKELENFTKLLKGALP